MVMNEKFDDNNSSKVSLLTATSNDGDGGGCSHNNNNNNNNNNLRLESRHQRSSLLHTSDIWTSSELLSSEKRSSDFLVSSERNSHQVLAATDGLSALTDNNGDITMSAPARKSVVQLERLSKTSPILPSEQGRFRNSSESELTANKLRFHKLGLRGREREQETMQLSLERLDQCRQLVLIAGESGTGKTALAMSVQKSKAFSSQRGMFLLGKFDQAKTGQEPYAAFVTAFQQLVRFLKTSKEDAKSKNIFNDLQVELTKELSPLEWVALVQPFPELQELLCTEDEKEQSSTKNDQEFQGHQSSFMESGTPEKEKSRFHNSFRKLVRIISGHCSPLVLVLDDLQWADFASLDLLELLLTDPKCSKIMIIGCYRSNEVDETHSFSKAVRDLRLRLKDGMEGVFEITDISIGNLNVPASRTIISDLLSTEESQLHELAQVCHDKTHGNAFFLIRFLTMLYNEKFLEFQIGAFQWKYDIKEIQAATGSTDNVADLVKARMVSLDQDTLLAVKLAGCLGARFQQHILEILYEQFCESTSAQAFGTVLENLMREEILQEEGRTFVQWVHDKIQEAASMLVTADERKPFEKKMGETLVAKLNESQLDSTIFIVANLHNNGSPPTTPEESAQIAKLNLKAANHAATMSALEMASMYATRGIDLLPNDKWERQYDLTKSLYATACRIESCLGNHTRVVTLSNEVLCRRDTPIMELLPIFLAKVAILESQDGRFAEAIDVCLDVLKRLGCNFPRSKIGQLTSTIGGIIKINFTTKKLTPKAISEIPIVEDKKLMATMQILDKLGALCIISASPLFPLVAFRSLELTLKHGLCEASPAAFALVGMLLVAVSTDLQGGSIYANHALSLMHRLPNHEAIEARTMFLSHFFVLPWTQPLNGMVKPLLRAYEVGLMTGDIDSAVYAIGTYVTIAIIAGRPLEGLLDDCRVYFGQMRQLGRERMYVASKLCWQAILNLMGHSEDHLTLTGEVMDQDEFLVQSSDPAFESNLVAFYWIRAFLYVIFGKYAMGAGHAIENAKFIYDKFPCYPPAACCSYYMGISLIEAWSTSKKKTFKTHAKQMISKINMYAKKGNPNVYHYKLALEGEMLVLKGRFTEAVPKFEKAIAFSTRCGFIHDSALMNERYGEFWMHRMADEERGMYHLTKAHSLYEEWGAKKKASMLHQKYLVRSNAKDVPKNIILNTFQHPC